MRGCYYDVFIEFIGGKRRRRGLKQSKKKVPNDTWHWSPRVPFLARDLRAPPIDQLDARSSLTLYTHNTTNQMSEPRAKREKKAVEQFVVEEIKKTEELVVPKGAGDKLGDIENVKIKIEKFTGSSEELKTLHRICYGRPGKQTTIKKYLRDFCGFAAGENLEKKKDLIGKLDGKMIKTLLVTCDLPTTGTKKDNTEALAEFLMKPYESGKKSLAVKAAEKRKRSENKKVRAK